MTEGMTDRLVREAFQAYGDWVGWIAYDGTPMQPFDDMNPKQQEAWRAAIRRVIAVEEEMRQDAIP